MQELASEIDFGARVRRSTGEFCEFLKSPDRGLLSSPRLAAKLAVLMAEEDLCGL